MLSACASGPERARGGDTPEVTGLGEDDAALPGNLKAAANDVLFQAIGLVGTPYRYGGNSPETGFDCSGLIGYVYKSTASLNLPRTVERLQDVGHEVPRDRLRTGDLVIFNSRGTANHAGIYVGDSRFVHAPSTGGTVRLESLTKRYWAELDPSFRRP